MIGSTNHFERFTLCAEFTSANSLELGCSVWIRMRKMCLMHNMQWEQIVDNVEYSVFKSLNFEPVPKMSSAFCIESEFQNICFASSKYFRIDILHAWYSYSQCLELKYAGRVVRNEKGEEKEWMPSKFCTVIVPEHKINQVVRRRRTKHFLFFFSNTFISVREHKWKWNHHAKWKQIHIAYCIFHCRFSVLNFPLVHVRGWYK